MPMKIQGNRPGMLLPEIGQNGESLILDPLDPQMNHFRGKARAVKTVGQGKEAHRQEVGGRELARRPVRAGQLWDMEKNAVSPFHPQSL
jgi:hypothetical protein